MKWSRFGWLSLGLIVVALVVYVLYAQRDPGTTQASRTPSAARLQASRSSQAAITPSPATARAGAIRAFELANADLDQASRPLSDSADQSSAPTAERNSWPPKPTPVLDLRATDGWQVPNGQFTYFQATHAAIPNGEFSQMIEAKQPASWQLTNRGSVIDTGYDDLGDNHSLEAPPNPYLLLEPNSAALSASFVVPATTNNLQFMYRAKSSAGRQPRLLTFEIVDEQSSVPLSLTTEGYWQLAQLNIQPWQGRTIQLRFQTDDATQLQLDALLLVDDVPGWSTVNPPAAQAEAAIAREGLPITAVREDGYAISFERQTEYVAPIGGYLLLPQGSTAQSGWITIPAQAQSLHFQYWVTADALAQAAEFQVEVGQQATQLVTETLVFSGQFGRGWQTGVINLNAWRTTPIRLRFVANGAHLQRVRIDDVLFYEDVPGWLPSNPLAVQSKQAQADLLPRGTGLFNPSFMLTRTLPITNQIGQADSNDYWGSCACPLIKNADFKDPSEQIPLSTLNPLVDGNFATTNGWSVADGIGTAQQWSIRTDTDPADPKNSNPYLHLQAKVHLVSAPLDLTGVQERLTFRYRVTPRSASVGGTFQIVVQSSRDDFVSMEQEHFTFTGSLNNAWTSGALRIKSSGRPIRLLILADSDDLDLDQLVFESNIEGWSLSDRTWITTANATPEGATGGAYLVIQPAASKPAASTHMFTVPSTSTSLHYRYRVETTDGSPGRFQLRLSESAFSQTGSYTAEQWTSSIEVSATNQWHTGVIDLQALRKRSISVRFQAEVGELWIDQLSVATDLGGWTATDLSQVQLRQTAGAAPTLSLAAHVSLASSPFWLSDQTAILQLPYRLPNGGTLTVAALSGLEYATETTLASDLSSTTWQTATINLQAFHDHPIKLHVVPTGQLELGPLSFVAAPAPTPQATASVALANGQILPSPVASEQISETIYVQLSAGGHSLYSPPFVLDPKAEVLRLKYRTGSPNDARADTTFELAIHQAEDYQPIFSTTLVGRDLDGWRIFRLDLAELRRQYPNRAVYVRLSTNAVGRVQIDCFNLLTLEDERTQQP